MSTAIAKAQPPHPLVELSTFLRERSGHVQKVLPAGFTPDRFLRIVVTSAQKTPKLLECERASLFLAVMQAAALGLEPDSPMGLCYLIPYNGQVQLQFGYGGLMELARRSGQISGWEVEAVFTEDHFEYELGLDPKLVHRPRLRGPRGDLYAAYSVVRTKDGGRSVRVLLEEEANRAKAAAQGTHKESSPWQAHTAAMWMKTVIKRHAKLLPRSVELAKAVQLDTWSEIGERQQFDVQLPKELDPGHRDVPALEMTSAPPAPTPSRGKGRAATASSSAPAADDAAGDAGASLPADSLAERIKACRTMEQVQTLAGEVRKLPEHLRPKYNDLVEQVAEEIERGAKS